MSNANRCSAQKIKRRMTLDITKSVAVERSSSMRTERPTNLHVRCALERRNSLPSPDVIKSFVQEAEAVERVRNFSLTPKGVRNRGDRMRRKSTLSTGTNSSYHSNSSLAEDTNGQGSSNESVFTKEYFHVAILGADGVGKSTLKNQFSTSEALCINNKDNTEDTEDVRVLLDDTESYLSFVDEEDVMNIDSKLVDTVLVVFAVNDTKSYKCGTKSIEVLRDQMSYDNPIFLVANKADLARNRTVSEKDAQKVADKFRCKYIETSVVLNHNIDELLVGIVSQLRHHKDTVSILINDEQPPEEERRPSKVSMFTKVLLHKLMKIGHREVSCTDLFDV